MIRILYILFFTLITYVAAAQNSVDKKIVQFSGVIYDVDSNSVIPYVTLNNTTAGKPMQRIIRAIILLSLTKVIALFLRLLVIKKQLLLSRIISRITNLQLLLR